MGIAATVGIVIIVLIVLAIIAGAGLWIFWTITRGISNG